MDEAPVLMVDDLHVSYAGIAALRGVSFAVPHGRMVAVLGANGAGKSTLLNAIAGVTKPRVGAVLYMGADVTAWRTERRSVAGLVLVPEGRQLFGSMSVEENLLVASWGLGGRVRRRSLSAVYEVFPRLWQRRAQQAGTLSGGEQQMVAIGRGLMRQPRVLLLDEPAMGLAPVAAREVYSCIRRISGEGVSLVVVDQNAERALSIAMEGIVLRVGAIALRGASAALRDREVLVGAYFGASHAAAQT